MRASIWTRVNQVLRSADQWLNETPERALDQAYDAALKIKAIEDEHFDGKFIYAESDKYSENARAYFHAELKKYLKFAEVRLTEFKASRFIVDSTSSAKSSLLNIRSRSYGIENKERASVILEKLNFIDEVLDRYKGQRSSSLSLVPVSELEKSQSMIEVKPTEDGQGTRQVYPSGAVEEGDGILDKTGVLPRSIVGTLNRIRRDLDPKSEQQVVQNFRTTKAKTLISMRFILLLIIIPLLTQQLSKALIVGPIVDRFRNPESSEIFINAELEEEALQELSRYEERLRFEQLLGRTSGSVEIPSEPTKEPNAAPHSEPKPEHKKEPEGHSESRSSIPTPAVRFVQQEGSVEGNVGVSIEEKLREKAGEIARQYSQESANAVKNVFADLLSLGAFGLVIVSNRQEVAVLKSFIDETVYGLSDSAKAFIIILFTDMFVGFHSPHGWEVLLEGISRHLGLPASRDFIYLFIATFPVILDTIFKYWIFRYLNRISPSAVATYRNMNE